MALKEFANLSSRVIAQMCGVSHILVDDVRQVAESATSTRTGSDGKQYPATRKEVIAEEELPGARTVPGSPLCAPAG